MTFLGGLFGAALAALPAGLLTWLAAGNLAGSDRPLLTATIAAVAALAGLTVGAAISRRFRYQPYRLIVFTGLAASFGGGFVGAVCAAGITAAYLAAYGTWPSGILDQILFVLAIPAFAGVGWFAGAAVGIVVGVASGTILQGLSFFRR